MKILDDAECNRWLAVRSFEHQNPVRSQGSEGFVSLPETGFHQVFGVPSGTDAETQISLSQHLAEWFAPSEVLLWMIGWAMYTESQMTFFLRFRQRFGEARRLIDAPGHLFDAADPEDIWNLAQLLLFLTAFNWEGFVLAGDGRDMIWIADETIETVTFDEKKDAQMQDIVSKLLLKPVGK